MNAGVAIEAAASTFSSYRWNVDNQQFPLLTFLTEELKPDLDQSLTFPMDRFRLLLFQPLNISETAKYSVAAISMDDRRVRSIEFVSQGNATFASKLDGLKLLDSGIQKTILAGDGTRYVFVQFPDGEFRCALIAQSANRLNFIYASDGLNLRTIKDAAGRTISFNYTDSGIGSITQTWTSAAAGLSKTWALAPHPAVTSPIAVGLSSKDRLVTNKRVPANALVREYTAAMAVSDRLLARIFGGPNAVAAGNGFEPPGLAAPYPLYRGDVIGDDGKIRRGHLSYAIHLYGNDEGTADSPIYIPAGFTLHSSVPSPTDAAVTFYYPALGNLTDVTLAIFHISDFEIRVEENRVRIGNIGGLGGSSPQYRHSHIEFYRGNTGLPPAELRMRLRIDPAAVFTNRAARVSTAFPN